MAIDDLLDEHEQSERVRNWLKNNGAGLIGGVALGLAVIFGWQWWQRQQASQAMAANANYQAALASMAGADVAGAEAQVAKLDAQDTRIYAHLAALRLARTQSDAGKPEAAIATLKKIKASASLQPLVDIRLARLLIDAGKAGEALALLGDAPDSATQEARGDALLASGKRDQARAAYLKALTSMDVASPQRRLVELKLTDVGGTPPNPAQPT